MAWRTEVEIDFWQWSWMEAAWITEQRNNFSVVVILCANRLPNFKLEWKNKIFPSYYGGMINSDFCVGSNAYESS